MGLSDNSSDSSENSSENGRLVSEALGTYSRDIYYSTNGSMGAQLAAMHANYAEHGQFMEAYYRSDRIDQREGFVRFINQMNQQCESLQPGEERRVQLLCQIGTIHSTVLDFKLTPNNLECTVVDSAAHAKTLAVIQEEIPKLSHCSDLYIVTGETFEMNVQKSSNMCMYFASEQLRTLQEVDPYPDLYAAVAKQQAGTKVEGHCTVHFVSWNAMHPRFVKDTESRGLLEDYYAANRERADTEPVSSNKTLKEYVRDNTDRNEPGSDKYPNFPQKGRAIMNRALDTFLMGKQFLQNNMQRQDMETVLAQQPVCSNEDVRASKANLVPATGSRDLDAAFAVSDALRAEVEPDDPYKEVPPILQTIQEEPTYEPVDAESESLQASQDNSDDLLNALAELENDTIYERSREEYQKLLAKSQEVEEPEHKEAPKMGN